MITNDNIGIKFPPQNGGIRVGAINEAIVYLNKSEFLKCNLVLINLLKLFGE